MMEVMRSLSYVKKEGFNEFQKFKFAKHDDVTKSVREQLLRHGILPVPTVIEQSMQVIKQKSSDAYLTTVVMDCHFTNIDKPEDLYTVRGVGHGIDKNDLGPGKAITYAYKNILLKALSLETGEADNEETADYKPTPRAKARAKKVDPTAPMNKAELAKEYPRIKNLLYAAQEENECFKLWSEVKPQVDRMPDKRIEVLQDARDRFSGINQDTVEDHPFPGDL